MRKKLVIALIALLVVVVINFALPRAMPGDPVLMLLGIDDTAISDEAYDFYLKGLNLDKPVASQFVDYVKNTFTFNFGYSYHFKQDIASLIGKRIPNTLQIAIPAIILSSILAILIGVPMGMKKGKASETATSFSMIVLDAVPSFILALLFILLFSSKLGIFPFGSLNSIVVPTNPFLRFMDRCWHLTLPVLTLTLAALPAKYLMVRNTTAVTVEEKYIVYAKARGLSNWRIMFVHVFKNICQPFITMVGLQVGFILSGSLIIENIFSIKGMGSLIADAINMRDYPVLQATLFITALTVVVMNLITDIVCVSLNPRVKYGVYDEK